MNPLLRLQDLIRVQRRTSCNTCNTCYSRTAATLKAHEKRDIHASSSSARTAKLKSITLSFLGISSHAELRFVMLATDNLLMQPPSNNAQLLVALYKIQKRSASNSHGLSLSIWKSSTPKYWTGLPDTVSIGDFEYFGNF